GRTHTTAWRADRDRARPPTRGGARPRPAGTAAPAAAVRRRLACIYAVFLLKLATFYERYVFDQYTFGNWVSFFIVHVTVFGSGALAAWLLWSKKRFSLGRLRLFELALVGLPLLNQLWMEYKRLFSAHRLLFYLRTGVEPTSSGRTHALPWVALI